MYIPVSTKYQQVTGITATPREECAFAAELGNAVQTCDTLRQCWTLL